MPRRFRRRLRPSYAILISFGVLLIAWMCLPWEWSTIDDPGHVVSIRDNISDLGAARGLLRYVYDQFETDLAWGLFRPSYWLYPSLVYWLPPWAVHGIRLAMLGIAIAGPVYFLYRRGSRGASLAFATLILIASSAALARGLFFLSLQELSGAAFIGLGFAVRRTPLRTVSWLVAAWFKSPFSWILIGHSIELWRRGERRTALVNGALGIGTLGISYFFADFGSYTQRYFRGSTYAVVDAALQNLPKIFEFATGALLLSVIWWMLITGTRLRFHPLVLTCGVAFFGYTAQLLSWEVTSYYFGPILFLLGLSLVIALDDAEVTRWRKIAAGFLLPLIFTIWHFGDAVLQGLNANAAIADTRACLSQVGPHHYTMDGYLLNVATPEGAYRLQQMQLLEDAEWSGRITWAEQEDLLTRDSGIDYYIDIANSGSLRSPNWPAVCSKAQVTVYSLQ